jgi:hypothetical protein
MLIYTPPLHWFTAVGWSFSQTIVGWYQFHAADNLRNLMLVFALS